MQDFVPPNAEELAYLMRADDVADIMAITVPDAELSIAVQRAQNNDIFHTAANSVHELGIPRAHFVAVHTLATCAGELAKLPDQHYPGELREFLFELAAERLGEAHKKNLKVYMCGAATYEPLCGNEYAWCRVGAMVSNLAKLKNGAASTEETARTVSIIESCGNMGSGLNALRDRMLTPAKQPRYTAGSGYAPASP